MTSPVASFVGTQTITDLSGIAFRQRAAFQRLSISVWPTEPLLPTRTRTFLRQEELNIVSCRNVPLLRSIGERIPRSKLRAAYTAFQRQCSPTQVRRSAALSIFLYTERRLLNGRARHTRSRLEKTRKLLDSPSIRQTLRRLWSMKEVYFRRIHKRSTFREIASQMRLSECRVTELWARIRGTRGQILVELKRKVEHDMTRGHFLAEFFKRHSSDVDFLAQPMRKAYIEMLKVKPCEMRVPFTVFYRAALASGLRYRAIRYAPKPSWTPPPSHRQAFVDLLLYVVHADERFYVVFLDESAVCEGNFQKKQWRARGEANIVPSRMRYEKIEVLGALSRDGIIAAQFVTEDFNAAVFTAFACRAVHAAFARAQRSQQVVLFLDNAGRHKDQTLLEFARRNRVALFFNLPYFSPLNPIEFAWEHAKRPLRSMRDYHGYFN